MVDVREPCYVIIADLSRSWVQIEDTHPIHIRTKAPTSPNFNRHYISVYYQLRNSKPFCLLRTLKLSYYYYCSAQTTIYTFTHSPPINHKHHNARPQAATAIFHRCSNSSQHCSSSSKCPSYAWLVRFIALPFRHFPTQLTCKQGETRRCCPYGRLWSQDISRHDLRASSRTDEDCGSRRLSSQTAQRGARRHVRRSI